MVSFCFYVRIVPLTHIAEVCGSDIEFSLYADTYMYLVCVFMQCILAPVLICVQ